VATLVAALGGQPAVGATTSTATGGLIVKAEPGQQVHDEATGHRPPAGPRVAAYPADDAAEVVARPARALGTPTTPGLDDSLATGHDRHTIAPGVSLSTDRSYDAAGFVNSWVLTTDLAGPTRPALLSEAVSNAVRPSELADAAGAVAATNGDFFAINTTNAPIGPVVRDGVLLKADAAPSSAVGLATSGVAQIAELLLEGQVSVGGTSRPLAGLNTNDLPPDAVALYTPDWGDGDRSYVSSKGAVAEVVIQAGKVTEVRGQKTAKPVPDDGFVLLADGSVASALLGTPLGSEVSVDYHARSDAPTPWSLALGAHLTLVRDGVVSPINGGDATNTQYKPRTALGWTANKKLLMAVFDGSSSGSRGLTATELATRMLALGAVDAVMLDGGGSSQLVTRRPGDEHVSVTNVPSDGSQRAVPDAVGLVPPAGSGKAVAIDVRRRSDRLFPGLSRDLSAAGYDEAYRPAPLKTTRWRTVPDDLARPDREGVLRGNHSGTGSLEARAGRVRSEVPLRVLGALDLIEADVQSLALEPGDSRDIAIEGRDAEGFSAPIEPRDITLDYDKLAVSVQPMPDGTLRVAGLEGADGTGTILLATVQGHTLRIPVTVGLSTVGLSALDDVNAWTALASKAKVTLTSVPTADRPGAASGDTGIRLGYDFTNQPTGTVAAYAAAKTPLKVPAGAQRLSMWVKGDGHSHWLRAQMKSAGSTNVPFTFAAAVDWTGWRRVESAIPTGFSGPLTIERLYLVETSGAKRDTGAIVLDALDVRFGVALDLPDVPDQADPAVVEQGGVADLPVKPDGSRWRFAELSDTHVSAAGGTTSYAYRQTVKAVDEIAAAHPDFVLLSGDGVDTNGPADFALLQGLLTEHLPADIPVRWAVGNHESGATANGTLDQFVASTGRPTRQVFDAHGTRFILLNSTLGSLRLSDWSQVPWLKEQLDAATRDRSVSSVVVSMHHPVLDPTGTGASQLSDPYEGQLVEHWLAGFRARSGKSVALITGHAHTAHVRRVDGVLEFNAPVVGKTAYGDAGHGGFSAWSLVELDPGAARVDPDRPDTDALSWFRADVRPLLTSTSVEAPDEISVGASPVPVSASVVDEGMGNRVVPGRYPMSVTWSGGPGLAVVSDDRQAQQARHRRDTLAILDLRTMRLTAVRPGPVLLRIRAGSMSSERTVRII
jgi:predicted phosphodiesterase